MLAKLYGRLGRKYPTVFVAVELTTAFPLTLGTIALFTAFYDAGPGDFWTITAVSFALVAITLVVIVWRTHRRMHAVCRWIGGERGPEQTEEAWREAVGMPLELVRRDMPIPVAGVALPGCIVAVAVLDLGAGSFFPLFAGSLVALGYGAALHYFALELGMRPVVLDIARELPPMFHIGRRALPLEAKLMLTLPVINVITGLAVAALVANGADSLGITVLIALGAAFTISLELTLLLSKSIVRPIREIGAATERIARGDYEVQVPITTSDELGELSASFNEMAAGLGERERLREAFGTYLDREVARLIIEVPGIARGVELDVSVLFCDVVGFTPFAEGRSAPEVVAALNELFGVLVPVVERHGGHIDKFMGDGLMAVFGAPENYADHADRAVAAGVEMAAAAESGQFGELSIGVGINSGPVLAGSIGGAGRLNFSVIGDAVNVAARVEAATRDTGDPVLITEATRALLMRPVDLAPRGPVLLKGRDRPVDLFAPRVPGPRGGVSGGQVGVLSGT